MKMRLVCAFAGFALIGPAAFADTTCTTTPRAEWIPQVEALRKLADSGYVIESFRVTEGSCYRMKGWTRDGNRVELYHDPKDGRVKKVVIERA